MIGAGSSSSGSPIHPVLASQEQADVESFAVLEPTFDACDDSGEAFVNDFVAAWDKVMNLDRFELA